MSEPVETAPATPSNPTASLLLEDVFFAPLFQALQTPGITRGCGVGDDMEIRAGDGHHIAHATHDPRNDKGTYRPVNAIYKLDLRSGWMRFMDLVRPTARGIEHEITTLMVYAAATIDFQYAYP